MLPTSFHSGKAPLWTDMKGRLPRLASLGTRSANFRLSLDLVSFRALILMSGMGDTKYCATMQFISVIGRSNEVRENGSTAHKPSLAFVSHMPVLHESTLLCSTVCPTLLLPRPSALKVKQNRPGSPASVYFLLHLINSSFSHDAIIVGEGELLPREINTIQF